jgi:hypothetical protein
MPTEIRQAALSAYDCLPGLATDRLAGFHTLNTGNAI